MVQRVHKYGNGGQVKCYADGGKVMKKGKKKPKPKPEMLGDGAAAQAGTTLRDRRKEQMKKMGLKDGGKVEMKPPQKGGKPQKITTKNPPGGSQTPGAKGTYPKKGR